MASWAANGSMGKTSSADAASPVASAAATAARVAGRVTGPSAVTTTPGSVGSIVVVTLAAAKSAASIMRYRCPSGDVYVRIIMTFLFRAS